MLLTRHVLDDDSRSFKELFKAITTLKPSMLTFIYLNVGDEAWDWSLPSKVSIDDAEVKSKFSSSIYGREAYIWRGAEAPHEHYALTRDIILKRFVRRVEEEEDDDLDIEECSSDDSSEEEKVEDESSQEDEEEEEEESEDEDSSRTTVPKRVKMRVRKIVHKRAAKKVTKRVQTRVKMKIVQREIQESNEENEERSSTDKSSSCRGKW